MNQKLLLTVAEVAELLNKSESTVRRWHREGNIPGGFKLGPKCIRFVAKEVKNWIQEREKQRG